MRLWVWIRLRRFAFLAIYCAVASWCTVQWSIVTSSRVSSFSSRIWNNLLFTIVKMSIATLVWWCRGAAFLAIYCAVASWCTVQWSIVTSIKVSRVSSEKKMTNNPLLSIIKMTISTFGLWRRYAFLAFYCAVASRCTVQRAVIAPRLNQQYFLPN